MLVRVPASSANLGPGYDVLAAALTIELELEVTETGRVLGRRAAPTLPADRSNLCVRAFEALHPADGLRFEIRSEIPLARGLGSSAAAIVAGLVAADHLFELGLERDGDLPPRGRARGPSRQRRRGALRRVRALPDRRGRRELPAPRAPRSARRGSRPVLVIPGDTVPTAEARTAIPPAISVPDAVANVAAATQLVLGIERSDLALIGAASPTACTSRRAATLYPRSMELVGRRPRAGRDRGDDLRRGPVGDALVLLAGHRQGGRGGDRGRRRLGRGAPRAVQPAGRRRPGALRARRDGCGGVARGVAVGVQAGC